MLQEHPAVIAACVVGLADEKVGERIKAYRDMLPKSKVGKLLRREIRDEEKRRQET